MDKTNQIAKTAWRQTTTMVSVLGLVLILGTGSLFLGPAIPSYQRNLQHIVVTDESNPPISNVQSPVSG